MSERRKALSLSSPAGRAKEVKRTKKKGGRNTKMAVMRMGQRAKLGKRAKATTCKAGAAVRVAGVAVGMAAARKGVVCKAAVCSRERTLRKLPVILLTVELFCVHMEPRETPPVASRVRARSGVQVCDQSAHPPLFVHIFITPDRTPRQ